MRLPAFRNNTAVVLFFVAILVLKVYFIILCNLAFDMYDDSRNYQIAWNYVQGKGYTYDDHFAGIRISAFHASGTVFLYTWLIKSGVGIGETVIVFFILSTLMYLLGVVWIYRLQKLLGIKKQLAKAATVLYALYPSVLYAIGTRYHFDNIVMPFTILTIYHLIRWIKGEKLKKSHWVLLSILTVISCVLRAQMLLLYGLLGVTLAAIFFMRRKHEMKPDSAIWVYFITAAFGTVLLYIPILQKNHKSFGHYIISTQSGFELLQGHNPVGNGNWLLFNKGSAYDQYLRQQIPGRDTMNEYQESQAHAALAKKLIKENPRREIEFAVRKIARYFMPENMEPGHIKPFFRIHPFNLILHALFLGLIIYGSLTRQPWLFSVESLLLLIPVLATLLLSIVFYFDFKLRYHAEPYMIVLVALGSSFNRWKKNTCSN